MSAWLVEYSKSQKAFHIGRESEILTQEIRAYEQTGWIGDYEVLGRYGSFQNAQRACREFRREIEGANNT